MFACNAKCFAIVILVFLLFFLVDVFSGQTSRSFYQRSIGLYPQHVFLALQLECSKRRNVVNPVLQLEYEKRRYQENPEIQREYIKKEVHRKEKKR